MMPRAIFLLLAFGLLLSCDSNSVYDKYVPVGGAWDKDQPVYFELTAMDSVSPHTLYITMRNTYKYPYSNLFLITTLDYPNGKTVTDTLEYAMANPQGALLGSGWSDIKESKLWYKSGVYFKEKGTYKLGLRHAMRKNGNIDGDNTLAGVTDVGLRVERENKITE